MAEPLDPQSAPSISLAQAAHRLGLEARPLGNIARQHGFCTAVGRDLFFSEAHLRALKAMLKSQTRTEQKAAEKKKRKPTSTFGIHESAELRKQRRRTKKRQAPKETTV